MAARIPFFLATVALLLTGCDRSSSSAGSSATDLSAARAGCQTKLTRRGPSPQEYQLEQPPRGVRAVYYPSGNLKLAAWVTADPRDGKKHPAVVYAHGGFAFGAEDFDETQPYRDAGFVVITPTLRGENGNAGNFEWFYGEVDDVIAAGKYVAGLPYVDAKKIFVAGHSSGGAETILAAVRADSPFAAATPIGGYVSMEGFANDPQWREAMPFDVGDERELRLRSAIHFAKHLSCPVTFLVGAGDVAAHQGLDEFVKAATAAGKRCDKIELPGDHHSSKPAAIQHSAEIFMTHVRGGAP